MFITFLPVDKYGNRGYTNSQAQVVEVEDNVERIGDTEYKNWKVLAPQSFIKKWTSISPNPYPWIEVPGPARDITEEEWLALIEQAVQEGKCDPSYLVKARSRFD